MLPAENRKRTCCCSFSECSNAVISRSTTSLSPSVKAYGSAGSMVGNTQERRQYSCPSNVIVPFS